MSLVTAALGLTAFRVHHTSAQSCDDLEEELRICLLQTPAPVPEPTPEPATPETAQLTSAADKNAWVPKVGDTWQYNLNTPVNTDVDADVFFIDMGEKEHETLRWIRGVGRGLNAQFDSATRYLRVAPTTCSKVGSIYLVDEEIRPYG